MNEQNDLTSMEHYPGMRSFGNYDLVRRVDMGGMGEVYLAHQRTAFNREVAVKIIRDDLARDPLARARFFREAEVSSYLKHDHILPLFEFGEAEGSLFLVTPYISGGTLAQRLQARPLSFAEVQQLFTALVQAVAYIHRRGVVHRDLKPSNVLLDDEEASGQVYVRLIDFGIATKQGAVASPPLTPSGLEVGTLAYMAPERLDGIAAPSNDIYSLGVILYQMLTRFLPEQGTLLSGLLPAPLEAVVRRCIAANPEDRYASASDILPAIEQSFQALHVSVDPHISLSAAFSSFFTIPPRLIDVENAPGARQAADIESMATQRPTDSQTFRDMDYTAPTMEGAYVRVGMDADVGSPEKPGTLAAAALSVSQYGDKKPVREKHSRKRPLLMVVSLLTVVVLFVMAGLVFLGFPLTASASVNIRPQVHMLQQVYTITGRPSQTAIDVATASIPARQRASDLSSSQTAQTTGQRCNRFFFRCQQVVAPADVENLFSQLQQSLISQLSAQMDSQLQAIHAIEIGPKQFADLSASNTPDIGTVSARISATLAEQGSVEYIYAVDAQQLARLLLAQAAGPNTSLVHSTIQIGQPVVIGITEPGAVTMKIAAAGVEEYQYPSTQLQAILNHIKGMALDDARIYLRKQPGVDANSVSITIHATFGNSNTLPYNTSQIKIVSISPTILPSAALPVLSTPTVTAGSLTAPNV